MPREAISGGMNDECFWEYILVLPDKTKAAEFDLFLRKLNKLGWPLGLRFQKLTSSAISKLSIRAGASIEGLARQAEQLGLAKPTNAKIEGEDVKELGTVCRPFIYGARSEYIGWGSRDFFEPAERVMLVHSLLYRIKETGKDGLSRTLIPQLLHEKKIETFYPPHDRKTVNLLLKQAMLESDEQQHPIAKFLFSPVNAIKQYYGSYVAFYFAWLDFFTLWAMIPAVVGFLLWYFRGEAQTVDDSSRIPLFSMFVIFWSALFLKYWERQANSFAHIWGTLDVSRRGDVRPQFQGSTQISPVTGQKEIHFSFKQRLPRYVFSFLVTLVMLAVAVAVMCVFLNLEGYVHKNSPAYINFAAVYAEQGAIFDPTLENPTIWQRLLGFVPVVSHSMVILMLNSLYREVAGWLTDFENHRLEHEFQNSLIIKRFLFEAFDCYIALFYIAFYELDPIALRKELVGLYTVDSLRRVGCECLLPMAIQTVNRWLSDFKNAGDYSARKKNDDAASFHKDVTGFEAIEDLTLDEYEQFDDYMEMVIEFGYITLFASAFPLASALSVLCNFVELKMDMFKLAFVCRRPHAHRARNIGIWTNIMFSLFFLSIISNCFLFGFTTEQMMKWIPSWFQMIDEVQWDGSFQKDQTFAAGKGRYVVFLVFALEHALILAALLIFATIPSMPGDVQLQLSRREFEKEEAVKKMHLIRTKSTPSSVSESFDH